jgi:hypothetical protein
LSSSGLSKNQVKENHCMSNMTEHNKQKFALCVQYDGHRYHGWQYQNEAMVLRTMSIKTEKEITSFYPKISKDFLNNWMRKYKFQIIFLN